jgi:hypothetical protein
MNENSDRCLASESPRPAPVARVWIASQTNSSTTPLTTCSTRSCRMVDAAAYATPSAVIAARETYRTRLVPSRSMARPPGMARNSATNAYAAATNPTSWAEAPSSSSRTTTNGRSECEAIQ